MVEFHDPYNSDLKEVMPFLLHLFHDTEQNHRVIVSLVASSVLFTITPLTHFMPHYSLSTLTGNIRKTGFRIFSGISERYQRHEMSYMRENIGKEPDIIKLIKGIFQLRLIFHIINKQHVKRRSWRY